MSADPSRIRPRPADAVFYSVATAAALAGAVYFQQRGTTSGVLGCAGVALVLVLGALLLGGAATCPHCAAELTGLSLAGLKPYSLCAACLRYVRCEGGRVSALEPDHLARHAEFAIPLDSVARLPEACCVCLKPSSRSQDLVYTAAMRHSPNFPGGKSVNFKAAAPYCEAHFDAAQLAFEDPTPFPGISPNMLVETSKLESRFVLKVRSYGFYRAATRVA